MAQLASLPRPADDGGLQIAVEGLGAAVGAVTRWVDVGRGGATRVRSTPSALLLLTVELVV